MLLYQPKFLSNLRLNMFLDYFMFENLYLFLFYLYIMTVLLISILYIILITILKFLLLYILFWKATFSCLITLLFSDAFRNYLYFSIVFGIVIPSIPFIILFLIVLLTLPLIIKLYIDYYHLYANKTRAYYEKLYQRKVLNNPYYKMMVIKYTLALKKFFIISAPYLAFLQLISSFLYFFVKLEFDIISKFVEYGEEEIQFPTIKFYFSDYWAGFYVRSLEPVYSALESACAVYENTDYSIYIKGIQFFLYAFNLFFFEMSIFLFPVCCNSFFMVAISLPFLGIEVARSKAVTAIIHKTTLKTFSEILYSIYFPFFLELFYDIIKLKIFTVSFYKKYYTYIKNAYFLLKNSETSYFATMEAVVSFVCTAWWAWFLSSFQFLIFFIFLFFNLTSLPFLLICTLLQVYIIIFIFELSSSNNKKEYLLYKYKKFLILIEKFYLNFLYDFINFNTYNLIHNLKNFFLKIFIFFRDFILDLLDLTLEDLKNISLKLLLIHILLIFPKIMIILYFKIIQSDFISNRFPYKVYKYYTFRGIFSVFRLAENYDKYYEAFVPISKTYPELFYKPYYILKKKNFKLILDDWAIVYHPYFLFLNIFSYPISYSFKYRKLVQEGIYLNLDSSISMTIKKNISKFKTLKAYLKYLRTVKIINKYNNYNINFIFLFYNNMKRYLEILLNFFFFSYFYKLECILNEIYYINSKNVSNKFQLEEIYTVFCLFVKKMLFSVKDLDNTLKIELEYSKYYNNFFESPKKEPDVDFYTFLDILIQNSNKNKNVFKFILQFLCKIQKTYLYPETNNPFNLRETDMFDLREGKITYLWYINLKEERKRKVELYSSCFSKEFLIIKSKSLHNILKKKKMFISKLVFTDLNTFMQIYYSYMNLINNSPINKNIFYKTKDINKNNTFNYFDIMPLTKFINFSFNVFTENLKCYIITNNLINSLYKNKLKKQYCFDYSIFIQNENFINFDNNNFVDDKKNLLFYNLQFKNIFYFFKLNLIYYYSFFNNIFDNIKKKIVFLSFYKFNLKSILFLIKTYLLNKNNNFLFKILIIIFLIIILILIIFSFIFLITCLYNFIDLIFLATKLNAKFYNLKINYNLDIFIFEKPLFLKKYLIESDSFLYRKMYRPPETSILDVDSQYLPPKSDLKRTMHSGQKYTRLYFFF